MSRELKFRAWLNPTQEYINDWLDRYGKKPPRIMCWYYTEESLFDDTWLDTDDFKSIDVEQYTGLKDKNGKEIYEGDILKYNFTSTSNESEIPSIVCYSTERNGYILRSKSGDVHFPLAKPLLKRGVEVVGNIHENIETLERAEK